MRLRSLFFLLFLLCALPAMAQYPITVKDPVTCLYGLKNPSGAWVVPPRYTNIGYLGDYNRYYVQIGSEMGLIDSTGKAIIPMGYTRIERNIAYQPQLDGVNDSLDLAVYERLRNSYRVQRSRVGIIDYNGVTILPDTFRNVGYFQNNIAVCTLNNGRTAFAGVDGITGYAPEGTTFVPKSRSPYVEALLPLRYILQQRVKGYTKYGVCDETGKLVVPCAFDEIETNGLLPGLICTIENKKAGFFSRDGVRLAENVYELQRESQRGRKFLVVKKENRWGMLGEQAKENIPCRYDSIAPFPYDYGHDSTAFLCRANGRWEIFDQTGRKMTPVSYTIVLPQRSERSVWLSVKTDRKWGAVTCRGETLLPAEFDTGVVFGSFAFYWSPAYATAISNVETRNQVALYGFHPTEENDYGFHYFDGTKDTVGWVYETSNNERGVSPDNPYAYGMGLDAQPAFVQAYIPQTVSSDSVWYIPLFPEELRTDWRGEDFPDEYHLALKRTSRGVEILFVYTLLRNSTYSWLSLSHGYGYPNGLLRSDGVLLIDSVPGAQIWGRGFGKNREPFFYAGDMRGRRNIINAQGQPLLDGAWDQVESFNGDTVWVKRASDAEVCPDHWNLLVLATGKLLLDKNDELRTPVYGWGEKQVIAGTGKGFGLFDTKKMQFVTTPVYRFVLAMDNVQEFYSVTTFSGKTGVMDDQGKLVVDTVWSTIVQSKEPGYRKRDAFRYVLARKNEQLVFDQNGSHAFDDSWRKKTVDDALRNPGSYYSYRSATPTMTVDKGSVFTGWQYRLLADSLFVSPYTLDYRNSLRYSSNSWSSTQFSLSCEGWQTQQLPLMESTLRVTRDLAMANANVLSFRHTLIYEHSWGPPKQLAYFNYVLVNDSPVLITLDSLFTGHAWETVVTDTITAFLLAHPFVEAPCINANAYPYLLHQRFLLSAEGLWLYPPDWKNRETVLLWETGILIPWEKLRPYLRAEMKEKIGVK